MQVHSVRLETDGSDLLNMIMIRWTDRPLLQRLIHFRVQKKN